MHTLVPLLGPIGGGLAAFGASVLAGAVVAGAAASSAARTTSLLFLELVRGNTMLFEGVFVFELSWETLITKPEAADAMLQPAMISLSLLTLSVSLPQWVVRWAKLIRN